MNIQNDVIGLVLRENCKSKQKIDFIAWPSRCHDTICVKHKSDKAYSMSELDALRIIEASEYCPLSGYLYEQRTFNSHHRTHWEILLCTLSTKVDIKLY